MSVQCSSTNVSSNTGTAYVLSIKGREEPASSGPSPNNHQPPSSANTAAAGVLSKGAVEALLRDPKIGTAEMRASLKGLQRALTCPLCGDLFCDPVTVSCAHSFCRRCIDEHSLDNWHCPAPDCGAPLVATMGSFRKVYPPVQTAMESFTTICETLQQARPYWWKDCKTANMDAAADAGGRTTTCGAIHNSCPTDEDGFATADEHEQPTQPSQQANQQHSNQVEEEIDLMAGVELSPTTRSSQSSDDGEYSMQVQQRQLSDDDDDDDDDEDEDAFQSANEEEK